MEEKDSQGKMTRVVVCKEPHAVYKLKVKKCSGDLKAPWER